MKDKLRGIILFLMVFSSFSMKAIDFTIPRLSPLPVQKTEYTKSLNGEWWFTPTPPSDYFTNPNTSISKPIEVPGEWVMQGFNVEKGKQAAYYRTFEVPQTWKNNRVKLRCNAIYSDAVIYINGKEVGKHQGGFTAFEIDITSFVQWGKENKITIGVTNETLADSLASGSKYALHPLGGINRDISIIMLPETNFALFHVSTTFDKEYVNAVLKTEVEIENESDKAQKAKLVFNLVDAKGNKIALKNSEVNLGDIAAKSKDHKIVDFDVTKPNQWTPETPYLYNLSCELYLDNKLAYTVSRNVGFRTVEVRGNEVFVNNKPIKLRGINHHEVMPLRGRSLTGNIWEDDVRIFREANVNYFRTSHYPPDEALLEACDRLGMFVQVEAPFCWAHQTDVKEEDYYPVLINQHVEMVNLNRSHPSVIMWSLGNESMKYEEYFKKAGLVIREIDTTRPLIFSQWNPDADNGELEITNHHYPGPDGPNMYRDNKRPVTFDEYCHVNSYNRFELSADPGVRTLWGILLDRMWTDMYNSKGVLGGAIWAGIDDSFFLPSGGTVGYGTWGPIDGWRRPKPEYWGVKKAYSPVRITQFSNVDEQGVVKFGVENRHNFTNLSDCKIEWVSGDRSGEVNVDLEARNIGEFEINLGTQNIGEDLYIKVTSPLDFVIDEYNFPIKPLFEKAQLVDRKGKLSVSEANNQLVVKTATNQFSINKLTGKLEVKAKDGQVVIQSAPTLMLLPLNSQGRGIQMVGDNLDFEPYNPVCTHWLASNITWNATKTEARITVEGTYAEAKGAYTYHIYGDGELNVAYEFTVIKPVNPRQVGLVFDLDKDFTQITWDRKGYWNYYPENDLGAISGTAKAYNPEQPTVGSAGPGFEPSLPWAFDQNEAGSNLFRSTKVDIYSASLEAKNGHEVSVTSDGNQSFRAWLNTKSDNINMLVADYNNAGMEGYLSSHASKDYKPLKKGDVVKGNIVLYIK